jgi:hypothetical protein
MMQRSDGQHCEDRSAVRSRKALRRFLRLTRVTGLETTIGAAVCAPGVDVPLSPARIMLTPTPTWTGPWGHDEPRPNPKSASPARMSTAREKR